jgi:hypothetical protein
MSNKLILVILFCIATLQVKAQYSTFDPLPYVPEPETPVYTSPPVNVMPYPQQAYHSPTPPKDQVYSILNIEYASVNNRDLSAQYQTDTAKLVIYRKNGVLCMCIIMMAKHSQSFGTISNVINSDNSGDNTSYYTTTSTFNWSYQNSYDSNKGIGTVMIKQVSNPSGPTFIAEVKTDSMDMVFQGHKQR